MTWQRTTKLASVLETKVDSEFWGVSAKIDIDLGNEMVLTSITAYDDLDNLRPEDTDQSPLEDDRCENRGVSRNVCTGVSAGSAARWLELDCRWRTICRTRPKIG